MGYPMTFSRVKARNHHGDGSWWHVTLPSTIDEQQYAELVLQGARDNVRTAQGRHDMLLADLIRMEMDACDEKLIAERIAAHTGIDIEIVAAVLLTYFRGGVI